MGKGKRGRRGSGGRSNSFGQAPTGVLAHELEPPSLPESPVQTLEGAGEENYAGRGEHYQGQFKDGVRHGHGRYVWRNKDSYEGAWVEGRMHGDGSFEWASGDVFHGSFRDGVICGQGTKTLKTGDIIEGMWRDGMLNGFGTKRFASGDTHEGMYKDNVRHGFGTYRWGNGDLVQGEWLDGQIISGLRVSANGTVYRGSFRDNLPCGRGVAFTRSGARYEGEFEAGVRKGYGAYRWSSGDTYTGEWDGGWQHGRGRQAYVNAEGEMAQAYDGDWRKGVWHGLGVHKLPSGETYSGNFRDGERHGHGTYTWLEGDTYEGQWVKNKRSGRGIVRQREGGLMAGVWRGGRFMEGYYVPKHRRDQVLYRRYGREGQVVKAEDHSHRRTAIFYTFPELEEALSDEVDACQTSLTEGEDRPEEANAAGADKCQAAILADAPKPPAPVAGAAAEAKASPKESGSDLEEKVRAAVHPGYNAGEELRIVESHFEVLDVSEIKSAPSDDADDDGEWVDISDLSAACALETNDDAFMPAEAEDEDHNEDGNHRANNLLAMDEDEWEVLTTERYNVLN